MTIIDIPYQQTIGFLNLTAENEESALWNLAQLHRFKKSPPFPPFVIIDSLSLEARYTNSVPPLIIFGNPDVDLVYPLVQSELASWYPRLSDAELSNLLANVGLEHLNLFRTTASLSGGQQLLLSLLPLWQDNVRCVILYHVSPWLDATSRSIIRSRLRELQANQVSIFIFEREESQLLSTCDKILVQFEGDDRIVCVNFQEIEGLASRLYPTHDGHDLNQGRESCEQLLTASHLRYTYADAPSDVIANASININIGEAVGLIGPNGSGKSTLAKMLSGLTPLTSGQVYLDGTNISHFSIARRSRQLALLFQNPAKQLCGLNIAQEFSIGLSESEKKSAIEYFQRHCSLPLTTPLAQLRNWHQRLVLLSIAFARNPQILILDEPTWGLSISERRQLMHLILELRNKTDIGLLIISHDFNLIMAMCQRAYYLNSGFLTDIGNPLEWFSTQTELPPDINISPSLKGVPKSDLQRALASRY